jgi:hypothetical protein
MGMTAKCAALCVVLALIAVPILLPVDEVHAQSQVSRTENISISSVGDSHYEAEIICPLNVYMAVKQAYGSDPYVIMRALGTPRASGWYENFDIRFDDARNALTMQFDHRGYAVNHGTYWEIQAGYDATLVAQTGNTLTFTFGPMYLTDTGLRIDSTTSTVTLPEGASQIAFDKATSRIKYSLPGEIVNDDNRTYLIAVSVAGLIAGVALLLSTMRKKLPAPTPRPSGTMLKIGPPTPQVVDSIKETGQHIAPPIAFCTQCGSKISDQSKFCENCGSKLS